MRRALLVALASVCGCATTTSSSDLVAQEGGETREAKCRIVGSTVAGAHRSPHESILDERTSMGPTKVIWIHPPNGGSLIRTAEGFIYKCDRVL